MLKHLEWDTEVDYMGLNACLCSTLLAAHLALSLFLHLLIVALLFVQLFPKHDRLILSLAFFEVFSISVLRLVQRERG